MERGLGRDMEFSMRSPIMLRSISEESYPLELELHPAEFQLWEKEERLVKLEEAIHFINKKLKYLFFIAYFNFQY